jgi:hypothetical protein
MRKPILIGFFAVLVIGSLIVAGIIWVNLEDNEEPVNKSHSYTIFLGGQTYLITVGSNYSSAPEVSYLGILKSVSVDFRGERENAFCNITIPINLIWGKLSVIDKVYEMSEADYIKSSNSTHNSVYFTFNHTALVKHFEVMGTEGVTG